MPYTVYTAWMLLLDSPNTVGPNDKTKTALRTCFGHYQCKFLLFGLTIAPPTFQTVTDQVFSPAHFGKECKRHDGP